MNNSLVMVRGPLRLLCKRSLETIVSPHRSGASILRHQYYKTLASVDTSQLLLPKMKSARQFSSVVSKPNAPIPKPKKENKKPVITEDARASNQFLISGLTKFASRLDLLDLIKCIEPASIDPVLDEAYYPTGKYAITCKNVNDANKLNLFFCKQAENSRRPLSIAPLTHVEYEKLFTTRQAKISMRTVRVEIMQAYCTREDIWFIFRDFRVLSILGLDYLSKHAGVNGVSLFLVDFESAEEAERAVQEKLKQMVFVGSVRMLWYNC